MPTKVHIVKAMFFSSNHVWMWELYHKEDWALKYWCFWVVVLEKTLGIPLDSKEIKPVNPKGNQPWVFIESTDAEAPILWPPDVKSWFSWKDPDAGKDWRQEEKETTDDEMVGWHHWLNGHEFEQTPWVIVKDREAWCAAFHGVSKSLNKLGHLNNNNRKVKTRSETQVYRMNEWISGFHSHTLSRNSSWKGSVTRHQSLPIGLASGETMTSCPASPPAQQLSTPPHRQTRTARVQLRNKNNFYYQLET